MRVLQHLLIAAGIAESGDGPPADVLVDADGLAGLVGWMFYRLAISW
jgi:hypothetical protein